MSSPIRNSAAWNTFTYLNFGVAALMMTLGIWYMEATFSTKGFFAMASLMLVSATVSLTKNLRDNDESQKLHQKLEDARTDKLLMEVNAGK